MPYVATDKDGYICLYRIKPKRKMDAVWSTDEFITQGIALPKNPIDVGLKIYPTWDDEPVSVKIELTLNNL